MKASLFSYVISAALSFATIATASKPVENDTISSKKAEISERNVMLNASDANKPREIQIGLPSEDVNVYENTALQLATGKILDVGAGSGCHSLALQEAGKDVHAIDISPLSVEVMQQRGVRHATLLNLFDEHFQETYDTILMLMNGSGIIGKLKNLPAFFKRMKQLLQPSGCIFMDSSDLRYLFEEEDGSFADYERWER